MIPLLVAVDPGTRRSGVAVFIDGVLEGASACVGGHVLHRVYDLGVGATLAIEIPQIYRAGKSKGDPNDLIKVAVLAGRIIGAAEWCSGHALVTLSPRDWAGGMPKTTTGDPWASPRGLRIRSRLSVTEVAAIIDDHHDTMDAIGIGLHVLGRLSPTKRYPTQ